MAEDLDDRRRIFDACREHVQDAGDDLQGAAAVGGSRNLCVERPLEIAVV